MDAGLCPEGMEPRGTGSVLEMDFRVWLWLCGVSKGGRKGREWRQKEGAPRQ